MHSRRCYNTRRPAPAEDRAASSRDPTPCNALHPSTANVSVLSSPSTQAQSSVATLADVQTTLAHARTSDASVRTTRSEQKVVVDLSEMD